MEVLVLKARGGCGGTGLESKRTSLSQGALTQKYLLAVQSENVHQASNDEKKGKGRNLGYKNTLRDYTEEMQAEKSYSDEEKETQLRLELLNEGKTILGKGTSQQCPRKNEVNVSGKKNM